MRFSDGDFEFDSYDDEEGLDIEAEMMADAIVQSNENRVIELQLADRHMRMELLDKAISIAKSDWLWFVLSNSRKLRRVVEIYETLKTLVD